MNEAHMQTFLQSASLSTTHLWFSARAITPLEIDAASGSAFRGSFFNAIWLRFCTNKDEPSCAVCPLHTLCPVSAIVAPLREENPRGQDIPRPYVIVPPLEGARRYQPGEHFSFGMTLIGSIVQLLPYILLSLPQLEAGGLGHPLAENAGKRGRFQIEKVETYHPFTSERQTIYEEGQARVQAPAITILADTWTGQAAQLNQEHITLRFVTPLRLVHREHLVKQATFRPFIHRLLERYLALEHYYGNQQVTMEWAEREAYLHLAESVVCTEDHTTWLEFQSYSNRQKRSTPISGLLGEATFKGNLAPFLELLVIGELIHAGKNAVKGNGKYHIVRPITPGPQTEE
jgi:hypothetical protein